jgi:hypothetical protein
MPKNYSESRIRLLEKLVEYPNLIKLLNTFNKVCPYPDTSVSINEIFSEVEAAGITLNATLKDRIRRCTVQEVRQAIEDFNEICKQDVVSNPDGLFYRLLEKKSNGFGFF